MVASFVKNGVLNETLFLDPSFSGELFVIYTKVAPFLKELGEKSENPTLMANLESVILSEAAKPRLEQRMKNVEKPAASTQHHTDTFEPKRAAHNGRHSRITTRKVSWARSSARSGLLSQCPKKPDSGLR